MFRKTRLLILLLLLVEHISATFDNQYVQMEVPIETFEPLMEKYDIISTRQCGLLCTNNEDCKGFDFQNSICVGSLLMTSCQLFKPVDKSLIPNVLSGSVSLLYLHQSQLVLLDDLLQNQSSRNYICKGFFVNFLSNNSLGR